LERVIHFRRSVLQGIMLWWDNRSAIAPASARLKRTTDEK
jgi:hypothetical protein